MDRVLTAIQKQVMIFSLSGIAAGSEGASYLGSSSRSSSSCDDRGSMLSTRPSVEGRFSAAHESQSRHPVALQGISLRVPRDVPIAAVVFSFGEV